MYFVVTLVFGRTSCFVYFCFVDLYCAYNLFIFIFLFLCKQVVWLIGYTTCVFFWCKQVVYFVWLICIGNTTFYFYFIFIVGTTCTFWFVDCCVCVVCLLYFCSLLIFYCARNLCRLSCLIFAYLYVRPGSDVVRVLYMSRIEFEFRPTQTSSLLINSAELILIGENCC